MFWLKKARPPWASCRRRRGWGRSRRTSLPCVARTRAPTLAHACLHTRTRARVRPQNVAHTCIQRALTGALNAHAPLLIPGAHGFCFRHRQRTHSPQGWAGQGAHRTLSGPQYHTGQLKPQEVILLCPRDREPGIKVWAGPRSPGGGLLPLVALGFPSSWNRSHLRLRGHVASLPHPRVWASSVQKDAVIGPGPPMQGALTPRS